ncbi:hypothetical protein Pcinc_027522 [Petrolisthes cinctipes]|uniref:Uncharacterized protein n=1 Tax=Petrolisthes cinctipes TaxID=88211 RepID=A0AAE1F3U0_PETCI|nr:hypothetical protein Pcinc_027522 [Petrolisthes cinctipes]
MEIVDINRYIKKRILCEVSVVCGVLQDARQGSDARQQVKVLAQVSSHREPGKVARRQARQERVESDGPGVGEVNETRCDRPF